MKKRSLALLTALLFLLTLATSVTFAWLSDSLQSTIGATSYVHKSYFESGDGTSSLQYNVSYDGQGNPTHGVDGQGNTLASEEGCAFEIRYPLQLYYFAWLQNLGYFNDVENGTAETVHFYLSADLDMSDFVLPPIGTEEYPFIGEFDGNGHTITNLTITTSEDVTDKPSEGTTGANIVGFFGVVGSLGTAGSVSTSEGAAATYTYSSAANSVKNVTLSGAYIETEEAESLAGVAAGYVNGTMQNVKVVGGTISSSADTALSYTDNLSDFGAVGYCTDEFTGTNRVTTIRIYDPQVVTNNGGGGSTIGQNNQWGGSIEMQNMYTDLVGKYTDAGTGGETATYDAEITVTYDKNGNEVSRTVNSTGTATLSANGKRIRVREITDNGDVIASYSLVERNDTSSFVYLYGENTLPTQTQTVHNIYQHELPAIMIYSNGANSVTNYLTSALGNTTSSASAGQWVNDSGKLYTVSGNATSGYTKEYLMNNAGTLALSAAVAIDDAGSSATVWTIDDANDEIYNSGYYLCYKDNTWKLVRKETNYITESTSTHYLTVSGNPAAISNTDVKANALSWTKTTVTGGYYLSAAYNGATYYLTCSSAGVLSLTSSATTVWNEVAASGTAKPKVYTLTSATAGWALYFDGTAWATTGYTTVGTGDDWGGSVDFLSMNKRLWSLYNSANGPTNTLKVGTSTRRYKYYNPGTSVGSVTFDIPGSGNNTNPLTSFNVFRLNGVRNPSNATTPETYLPLIVADDENGDYSANIINTGYIVSGNNDNYGDIRVATYPIKYLNNSLNSTKYTIAEINGAGTTYTIRTGSKSPYTNIRPIEYNSTTNNRLEILTNRAASYGSSSFARISDSFNENNTLTCLTSYTKSVNEEDLLKYTSSRTTLDTILQSGGSIKLATSGYTNEYTGLVHGLHFMGSTISNSAKITADNVVIKGSTYSGYELPKYSIDFNLNSDGVVNLFAGTYYGDSQVNVNSFFSLWEITRNPSDQRQITSITQINGIYKNASGVIAYSYGSGAPSAPSGYSSSDLVFDVRYLTSAPPEQNVLYYFEFPMKEGEYAMGSVSGSSAGAYLLYLDISANATVEGDSMFDATSETVEACTDDAAPITYTTTVDTTESVPVNTKPTFFPLAWNGNSVASTNSGYVIGGANYQPTGNGYPGDIRVSVYNRFANGTWVGIRRSLTNNGQLNNGAVYTTVNGTDTFITNYGIGNQLTQNYARVSAEMNAILANRQADAISGTQNPVYGLHFMPARIDASNTIVAEKAVINGTTYYDYELPQDSVDFVARTKGRVNFFAGTYYSGSTVQSFFSLNQVFRDSNKHITGIRELAEIYSDGNDDHHYIYRYYTADGSALDNTYYDYDGAARNGLPSGYEKIFDMGPLRNQRNNLNADRVYYFEVPVDVGEFALGSAQGNGAYLLYLDVAANAEFTIETDVTELTETVVRDLKFPLGVAFVDSAGSTAFDTNGVADPSKSVFLSIPIDTSEGDTTFAITSAAAMTVTNTTSSLAGYEPQCVPDGASLTVNGGNPVLLSGTHIFTRADTYFDGTSASGTTTVTTTDATNMTAAEIAALIPFDPPTQSDTKAAVVFEATVTGNDLTSSVDMNGIVNAVPVSPAVTYTGTKDLGGEPIVVTYTVYDAVRQTTYEGEGSQVVDSTTPAATYAVTISGPAGSYVVNVATANTDFDFTVNGTAVSAGNSYTIVLT